MVGCVGCFWLACPRLQLLGILFPSLAWSTLVVSVLGTDKLLGLLMDNGYVEVMLGLY